MQWRGNDLAGEKWIELIVLLGLAVLALMDGLRLILRHTTTFGANQAGSYLVLLGSLIGFLTIYAWLSGNLGVPKFQNSKDKKGRIPKQVIICLLILAGSSFFIPWLGYMISTLIFFFAYFLLLGGYPWVTALLLSTVFGVSMAFIFAKAGMMLPQGFIHWP